VLLPSVLLHATEIKGVLNARVSQTSRAVAIRSQTPSLHHFVIQGLLAPAVVLGCGFSLARVRLCEGGPLID